MFFHLFSMARNMKNAKNGEDLWVGVLQRLLKMEHLLLEDGDFATKIAQLMVGKCLIMILHSTESSLKKFK